MKAKQSYFNANKLKFSNILFSWSFLLKSYLMKKFIFDKTPTMHKLGNRL